MNITLCDACPARAQVTVGKPGFSQLAFCGHHFNASSAALFEQGWLVLDRVTSTVAPAADTSRVVHRSTYRS